jgi:uncharacterized membrane protein
MKFEWEVSIFTRNVIFIVGLIILAIVFYFVFFQGGVGNFNSLRAFNLVAK